MLPQIALPSISPRLLKFLSLSPRTLVFKTPAEAIDIEVMDKVLFDYASEELGLDVQGPRLWSQNNEGVVICMPVLICPHLVPSLMSPPEASSRSPPRKKVRKAELEQDSEPKLIVTNPAWPNGMLSYGQGWFLLIDDMGNPVFFNHRTGDFIDLPVIDGSPPGPIRAGAFSGVPTDPSCIIILMGLMVQHNLIWMSIKFPDHEWQHSNWRYLGNEVNGLIHF